MQRKRVLIVSTAYLPLVGGAEVAVKAITDRLEDYDFDLICARLDRRLRPREQIGRVFVRRYGIGSTADKYILPFFAVVRGLGGRYGIIWTIMASYGAFAATVLKRIRPSTRHVLTLQEGDSEEHIRRRVGIFYGVWRSIFKNADYIQAISTYLADLARRHGAQCPIEVIPNGVDIKSIKDKGEDRKQEKFVIVTTSRLVHKNGIDILIRAAHKLKSLIPDTKYLVRIVGSGKDEKKLKALAKELGVEDTVEFVGHVDPSQIPDYLARAAIFVRPARSEGLGSSYIEAMAAGLPIIGTPVGGIPDFLRDNETGLFAKPEDHVDLAEKISRLVNDDALRNRLAEQGRKLAYEKYSWDSIAEKMGTLFRNVTHSQ